MSEIINVPEIFGKNVFNDKAMQERLPKSVYKKLKKTIEARCDALFPLVPAADRHYGRKT